MNWKVIKTPFEYRKAVNRTMEIFQADEGSPEEDELALLLVLVKDYEDKNIRIAEVDPIEVIKLKMEERDLKQKTLNLCLVQKVIFHPSSQVAEN